LWIETKYLFWDFGDVDLSFAGSIAGKGHFAFVTAPTRVWMGPLGAVDGVCASFHPTECAGGLGGAASGLKVLFDGIAGRKPLGPAV